MSERIRYIMPADDALIEEIERDAREDVEVHDQDHSADVLALLLRFRSEQKTVSMLREQIDELIYRSMDDFEALLNMRNRAEAAEAIASSIREKTIMECAEIAEGFACGMCGMDGKISAAIRALSEPKTAKCEHCNNDFPHTRMGRKYCSTRCRVAAMRARDAEKESEANDR